MFILAATDYFSRWSEAAAYKEITAETVVLFFQTHVLHRFGVPRRILSDNGSQYRSNKILKFARSHNIDWRYSSILIEIFYDVKL